MILLFFHLTFIRPKLQIDFFVVSADYNGTRMVPKNRLIFSKESWKMKVHQKWHFEELPIDQFVFSSFNDNS